MLSRRTVYQTRTLGKTGVRVTVLALGGYHIGKPSDPEMGVRIIRAAVDEGINFLDNAWCYHDGKSEEIMGRALKSGYREKVFLMTKNHGRDAATFRRQLNESLRRLRTDHIDLLQFPTNLLDAHYRSFTKEILPIGVERGIGIIGMKSLAGGQLLQAGISPREAITYTLSLPIHTLVSGIDSLEVLRQNLKIVRTWKGLSEEEEKRLLERSASPARAGHLEWYKTA